MHPDSWSGRNNTKEILSSFLKDEDNEASSIVGGGAVEERWKAREMVSPRAWQRSEVVGAGKPRGSALKGYAGQDSTMH